jgi:hypothetical protein
MCKITDWFKNLFSKKDDEEKVQEDSEHKECSDCDIKEKKKSETFSNEGESDEN